jgi:enoyl-CoA hydratase
MGGGRALIRNIVPITVTVMESPVSYRLEDSVATITMDDGKVNVLSPRMLDELAAAFDRAAADAAVVVLRGRDGVFSAGFDLTVLGIGGADSLAMVRAGFGMAERILSFPTPVVVACTGHAVAMGLFLLLSGDYRIGPAGSYKLVANEVAIGLPLPNAAIEILRQRLAPAYFNRAALLAEPFSPDNAVEAGILDRVVEADRLDDIAREIATATTALDLEAHAITKLRARQPVLDAIRTSIDAEYAALGGRT